ncbi:MAG: ABC transporter ATP-binding protein [Lentisphaeria bacterium]|nr:ABC transporter ATP-binding protein [Candidatus Neomarinimicrobiota bacterium]MCF7842372.1 ABC transporter ATP-binding protein [Lentisphaeria bacterium]
MLKASGITKTYHSSAEDIQVLQAVHLEVNAGEIVAISGPSGIGKTTLLNILGTLDRPDGGDLTISGKQPFALNDIALSTFRARHLGFVFQFHYLLPEFTALENVMIPGRILSGDVAQLEARGEELLEAVGISHRMHHKPSQLSGGERQRVAVARALMNSPALVLADEPTGNLDPENGERLMKLFLELRGQFNQTFLIATHNRQLAQSADRTVRLTTEGMQANGQTSG